jgi:hypothetical protein
MGKDIIRILVNQKGVLEISPLTSLYSLRSDIRGKFYSDYPSDKKINLFHSGKCLTDDSSSLYQLGIRDKSSIKASISIEGGTIGADLFWIFYFLIIIPGFLIFLLSGLVPIFASGMNLMAVKGVNIILEYFKKDLNPLAMTLLHGFFYFIKAFFIIFYVWALTFYVFFPWLYRRKNIACASGLTAKRIGWWTMVIFIVIYFLMNSVDLYFEMVAIISGESPQLAQAFVGPGNKGAKEAWDEIKFIPAYALLPPLLNYHETIDSILAAFYTVLGEVGQFDCNDTETIKELCQVFTTLHSILAPIAKAKSSKDQKTEVSKKAKKQKKKLDAAKGRAKKGSLTSGIMGAVSQHMDKQADKAAKQQQKQLEDAAKQGGDLGMKLALGAIKPTLEDWDVYPAVKLIRRGMCDRYAEDLARDQYKPVVYEDDPEYPIGSFNRWSARFFTNFFCTVLFAIEDFQQFMYSIGNEAQASNMIKTGSVAGLFAAVYFICSFIYAWFVDRMFGLPTYC